MGSGVSEWARMKVYYLGKGSWVRLGRSSRWLLVLRSWDWVRVIWGRVDLNFERS